MPLGAPMLSYGGHARSVWTESQESTSRAWVNELTCQHPLQCSLSRAECVTMCSHVRCGLHFAWCWQRLGGMIDAWVILLREGPVKVSRPRVSPRSVSRPLNYMNFTRYSVLFKIGSQLEGFISCQPMLLRLTKLSILILHLFNNYWICYVSKRFNTTSHYPMPGQCSVAVFFV